MHVWAYRHGRIVCVFLGALALLYPPSTLCSVPCVAVPMVVVRMYGIGSVWGRVRARRSYFAEHMLHVCCAATVQAPDCAHVAQLSPWPQMDDMMSKMSDSEMEAMARSMGETLHGLHGLHGPGVGPHRRGQLSMDLHQGSRAWVRCSPQCLHAATA